MRTYWLLSEDDSRIQERFGTNTPSLRRDVAPDLICNNTIETPTSPSSPHNEKQPNQQMSQYLRQRARSSYHSEVDVPAPTSAVSFVGQPGHSWASPFTTLLKQNEKMHSSTCMITHRYRHGAQPQVNGNIIPAANSIAKNANSNEALQYSMSTDWTCGNKLQPYLMGARNSNKVYYCEIERSPRSAPQITFM